MVLLPLAKEVMSGYGNLPVLVSTLKAECQESVILKHGFKSVDYSLLNDDNLWYLRQLELDSSEDKERYIRAVGQVVNGDHIPVFK